jgi:hypothetical protein
MPTSKRRARAGHHPTNLGFPSAAFPPQAITARAIAGLAEGFPDLADQQAGLFPARGDAGNAVLSQSQFAEAVRSALRDLHTPNPLQESPLRRSRVVRRNQRDGMTPAETLRELLEMAASALPPDLKALTDRTFLHPVTTQERIAEGLHLSFNTYRRHRDQAVTSIAEWLWAGEIGHRTSFEGPPASHTPHVPRTGFAWAMSLHTFHPGICPDISGYSGHCDVQGVCKVEFLVRVGRRRTSAGATMGSVP